MNKICTSIEQSKQLIKLGIDITTADMLWHRTLGGIYTLRVNDIITKLDIPAWSLAALLDFLPYPTLAQHANELWSLTAWVGTVEPYSVEGCDNKIDACVEIIVKLHEQKVL